MAKLPTAIVDLEDFNESINMIIYGDSGVGKTVLAGSAPNALIISTEHGTTSAKRFGSTAKVWPVKDWSDMEAAVAWLEDNPDVFDWVVVDSLTEMQGKSLRGILTKAVADNPSRDPDVPAIQDYQKWQNQVKNTITYLTEAPVNVIWLAGAMRKEDQEGDDIVLPLLLGKNYEIAAWACMQMDVVAYLGTKRVKDKDKEERVVRRLVASNVPPYFAKDRFNCLGRWVDDTTMPEIIQLIEESVVQDKDSAPSKTSKKAAAKKAPAKKKAAVVVADDDEPDED